MWPSNSSFFFWLIHSCYSSYLRNVDFIETFLPFTDKRLVYCIKKMVFESILLLKTLMNLILFLWYVVIAKYWQKLVHSTFFHRKSFGIISIPVSCHRSYISRNTVLNSNQNNSLFSVDMTYHRSKSLIHHLAWKLSDANLVDLNDYVSNQPKKKILIQYLTGKFWNDLTWPKMTWNDLILPKMPLSTPKKF